MNPATLTPGCELGHEFNGIHLGKACAMGGNVVRVELPRPESYRFLKQDQAYIVRHYVYDANAIELHGNAHLTLSNVTIYSAPGHAFISTGDQHHWKLERCRIVKRPGTTRCITATADGCHISNSQGYFIIDRCDFSYNGDDCLNIHDNSVQGFRRIDDKTIRLSRVQRWRNPFCPGDLVEFRHADLSPAGIAANVAAVSWDEGREQCELEFASELPAELNDRSILF
ncbi:right-handed parallel beta-helix repeat-containing protein [Cohnella rhizosphaerae]|uniref:Right-handed parallel beta-helix repeat-containing protein n=1 Tax=Cohnella rhizosphaerae TaxID=1457232 RepID=A0A9X4KWP9_9BACL|nr:right-handed parallel beta-helix repeat-containing protein [Cohnella rhizosphaerae]MDG0812255.1 right-handed parallel beta-helix repeat-containing protein [Cohnella rhizosphaerae]